MPKYYCDYCDIFLTHDSPSVRRSHLNGWKHKAAVEAYYRQFEQSPQDLIELKIRLYESGRAANMPQMFPGFGPPGFVPPPSLPPPPPGAGGAAPTLAPFNPMLHGTPIPSGPPGAGGLKRPAEDVFGDFDTPAPKRPKLDDGPPGPR